jgi:hypothetical protein
MDQKHVDQKTELSAAAAGDARTPDKKIGQIKYADGQGDPRGQDHRGQDHRGQDQSADKKRAQQSQKEGPAAYAPQPEEEAVRANPNLDPAKKKTGEF